jgi:ubiquinone/menaquinone biosynthesis C-methylase UbiE
MEDAKVIKIKSAVRSNFDESPASYQSFERKHCFFKALNGALLSRMNLPLAADILDVGCGTGASSVQMLEALPLCRVWGLDNSRAMLEAARASTPHPDRLAFVEGDAGKLDEYFNFLFDAIIYSASVFLIPDYRESLKRARSILKKRGSIGLTFMDGLYDSEGDNLFQLADRTAREGVSLKKPVSLQEFESFFSGMIDSCRSWNHDFRSSKELVRDFFSVPAMSAGLFPGIPYPERIKKVARLFDHMPKREILFRWRLMVGETPE